MKVTTLENLDRGITKPITKLQNTFYGTTVNLPECCVQCVTVHKAQTQLPMDKGCKPNGVSPIYAMVRGSTIRASTYRFTVEESPNHSTVRY